MKKTIKNRIKRYFTEKPKSNFWFWICIILILFRYVTPMMLPFMTMFQIGLIAPELDTEQKAQEIGEDLANRFSNLAFRMFESGQRISIENPLTAKILFYFIGWFIWFVWISFIIIILQLVRYGTSYLIRRSVKKRKKKR